MEFAVSPQVGQAVLAFARSYSNSGPNSVRAGRRAPPAPPRESSQFRPRIKNLRAISGESFWLFAGFCREPPTHNGETAPWNVARNTRLMWKVKYAPGSIETKGHNGGQQVLAAKRESSGEAAGIVPRADRQRLLANGQDVALITAEIRDAQDREVANADNELTFQVTGGGRLLGLGNGDPSNHELDTVASRRAFNGLCMAIVQSSKSADEIHVEASSPGLQPAVVSLTTAAAPLRPAVP